MEYEDCSSGSSSSNEQQPSPQTPPPALVLHSPRCSPPSTASSSDAPALSPAKRKAGRKKFRETRHPVYRGVRERNGGKWVCELREPQKKTRIWLGTYATPEMAARAHDVAAIALRGQAAPLNFADSAWVLPRPRSMLPEDIRCAASKAADMFRPPFPVLSPSLPSPSSSRAKDPVPVSGDGTRDGEAGMAAAADAVSLSSLQPAAAVFVDEDALLNMAELVDDMARGLMMTPPAMHSGFDLDDVEPVVDWSLWTD